MFFAYVPSNVVVKPADGARVRVKLPPTGTNVVYGIGPSSPQPLPIVNRKVAKSLVQFCGSNMYGPLLQSEGCLPQLAPPLAPSLFAPLRLSVFALKQSDR